MKIETTIYKRAWKIFQKIKIKKTWQNFLKEIEYLENYNFKRFYENNDYFIIFIIKDYVWKFENDNIR